MAVRALRLRFVTGRNLLTAHASHSNSVGIWGFKYERECMLPVLKIAMAAKPPSYEAVLELDRKIREFNPPMPEDAPDSPNISISMRCWVRSHFKEISE